MNRKEREEKLFIAQFAANVAGEMNDVTSKWNDSVPSGANRTKLRPEQFLDGVTNAPKNVIQPTRAAPVMPQEGQTVAVDVNKLQIPVQDEELKKAMERYEQNVPVNPQPALPNTPVGPVPANHMPNQQIGPVTLNPTDFKPPLQENVDMEEIRKTFGYIKRKVRAIEKNQEKILELLQPQDKQPEEMESCNE